MSNKYFQFKQFTVHQDQCAMKVTTDACLFGAWSADELQNGKCRLDSCLDIGCGTGLLSLMVAQKNDVIIDAIEIDERAAQQAKENVNASPWKERINIIQDDVLKWNTDKKYDCIISNPPFYEAELKSGRQTKDIAHHDDGLKLTQLFSFIKNHLKEEGIFFLLLPAKRENEIPGLMKQNHFYLQKKVTVKQ